MSSVEILPVSAPRKPNPWLLALGIAGLAWAFYPTLDFLVEKWSSDPQYSHGFLVPFFSAYLLHRRSKTGAMWLSVPRPMLAGVALAFMFLLRTLAGKWLFHQLDAIALLGSLSALALAFGGWRLAKVTAPAVLFLVFLIPLPYEMEKNVGGPLKTAATWASTYLLQTLGYPAIAEGNVILIDEVRLGVVDACSGLKMLMTFSAFAVGAVLTLDRTWFEKFLIVLGIVPIALLTNVLRIVATGIGHTLTANKDSQNLIHDVHGWLMMPLGLGFLAFQLWCLTRLVVRTDTPTTAAVPGLGFGGMPQPALA